LVGDGDFIGIIKDLIKEHPEYNIAGLISDREKTEGIDDIPILGNRQSIENVATEHRIDDIVVMADPAGDKELNMALINCRLRGINVVYMPTFYEQLASKLPVSQIKEEWLLYSEGFSSLRNKVYLRLKRVLDLFVSLVLIILFFPLGMIMACAIKLNSKGPVFYKQKRIGEQGKPFILIKFRTMVADAEKEGPRWATDKDPRITAVGKIFRKSRLDELPQLINVVKGDMSLIGPRPEREYFIEKLTKQIPYYSLRFSVKPGLTGWAQVNYEYGNSEEDALEKLRYELFYIKNMSLFLDLGILLKTIRVAFFGLGQ
jgi:sugar transferase (PEP-CTERM system associated)